MKTLRKTAPYLIGFFVGTIICDMFLDTTIGFTVFVALSVGALLVAYDQ